MPRKRTTSDKIINKLGEAEVLRSQGQTVAQASNQMGVSDQIYILWCREFVGMRTEQACKRKDLKKEKVRMKELIADLFLGIAR